MTKPSNNPGGGGGGRFTTPRAGGHWDGGARAAELYPRDRVLMNQAGRVLFLQGRLREAVGEFQKGLAIDPADLQAHYNLMLCYQGLGEEKARTREQKLYERFKADDASQAITGEYRRLNPEDNNERQQIHEHVSVRRAAITSSR